MQGKIIGWNAAKQTGVITTASGQRLMFRVSDWQHGAAQMPQAGAQVEFDADQDRARKVRVTVPAAPPRPAATPAPVPSFSPPPAAHTPPLQPVPPPSAPAQPQMAASSPSPQPPAPSPPQDRVESAAKFTNACNWASWIFLGLFVFGIVSITKGNAIFGVYTILVLSTSLIGGIGMVITTFIASIITLFISDTQEGRNAFISSAFLSMLLLAAYLLGYLESAFIFLADPLTFLWTL